MNEQRTKVFRKRIGLGWTSVGPVKGELRRLAESLGIEIVGSAVDGFTSTHDLIKILDVEVTGPAGKVDEFLRHARLDAWDHDDLNPLPPKPALSTDAP